MNLARIAVLDDYLGGALELADWGPVRHRCALDVYTQHIPEAERVRVLAPYDALCLMRERMPMPRSLIEQLPRLRLIVATGTANRVLDAAAAAERGIVVSWAGSGAGGSAGAPELTWALLLALARRIPQAHASMRGGAWSNFLGPVLRGKVLGLVGLGRIGQTVARYARAFDMRVLAWSQNLAAETAAAHGATRVEKAALFRESDFVSVHYVLSERSRGLIGAAELALMRPTAYLINTARGPLVDEGALLAALRERRIAAAALDVYDIEPLPAPHPLRTLENVLLTPHLGFVTEEGMRAFYARTVEALLAFLDA
jgi:phosphoglycerate dehydrogenase-like enzyme